MSLYRYVQDRDELFDVVVERIVGELADDPEVQLRPVDGWRPYLAGMAHGVRRYARAHPHAFPLVATWPPSAPWVNPPLRSLRWVEAMLTGLVREGFISLSEDVNTLADTVNPAHAAKRKAASARSAVLGAKDKVMGTASQSVSSTTSAAGEKTSAAGEKASAVQEKASAVQEKASAAPGRLRRQVAGNPLAVGLIAVGAGWLAGSLLPASSTEERAATKVKETAAPAVTGAAKDVAASLQDPARQAAESVKAAAADAAAAVKDETASSAHDVRDQALAARDTVTDSRR